MCISLKSICAKEIEKLKEKNIPHNASYTGILYYMLYDHLNLLEEFHRSKIFCYSEGSSMNGDRTMSFLPSYSTEVNLEYGLPLETRFQAYSFEFSYEALGFIDQLCRAIEEKGVLVEKDIYNRESNYEPYVVFNVALFKSACTANSLISATDEAYVKGLSEEGFNSLKSRLIAYSSLAKLDLEFAYYAKDANRIKGAIALSEDIATISQRMDQFREQANNVRSPVTTLGIFKIPDEPDSPFCNSPSLNAS